MSELTLDTCSSTKLLRVQSAFWEAENVIIFTLTHPEYEALPRWQPGSHLDIVLPSGLVRQYSLCGNPEDRSIYKIAVLRETNSKGGSKELHETALVGRIIQTRGPRNHFALVEAKSYLFIAGGIGITPILPMIHTAEKVGASWRVVYLGRSLRTMAFLSQLEMYPSDNVAIYPTEIRGRPDLKTELDRLTDPTEIYCCGPPSLISTISETCTTLYSQHTLHIEHFGATPSTFSLNTAFLEDGPIEIELQRSGISLTVPACRSVLDVIREKLPEIPFSCEEGYCGTCETAVIEGIPDHRDTILSPKEQKQNKSMMICVSRALSGRLVLDL